MSSGTSRVGSWTWRRLAWLAGGLAAATRIPGLMRPWVERDEAHIAVQAQTLLRGGHLYEDVIDRKPPLVPAIYAAVAWVSGTFDLRPVRALLVLWVAATALVVAAIVRRIGGSGRAAAVGAVLYVLGTVAFFPRDGQGANFELWGALPASGAMLLAFTRAPGVRRLWVFVGAGALVGIAACMKQPFLTTIAPVGVAAAVGPRPARSVLGSGLGLVAVIAAVGGAFGLDGMLRWAWTENGGYVAGRALDGRVLGVGVLMTLLFAATHASAMWLGLRARLPRGPRLAILVWLAVSAVTVVAGFRFLGHYYQPLVAPLCVLAGIGVERVGRGVSAGHLGVAAATAVAAIVVALSAFAPQPMEMTRLRAVIEARTEPGDPILVWGDAPEIYWRTNRSVAGAFVQSAFLTSSVSGRGTTGAALPPDEAEERWRLFLSDLRSDPPLVVVDTSSRRRGFDHRPAEVPLGEYLRAHYERAGTLRGMEVWVREAHGDAT
ncbi:MAG TPA: hypothetical protein VF152_03480 [Acidimicrobiia bacterium]